MHIFHVFLELYMKYIWFVLVAPKVVPALSLISQLISQKQTSPQNQRIIRREKHVLGA